METARRVSVMKNGTGGVGQAATAVIGECQALHAQARLYLHVAQAALSNRAKRDVEDAALFARNFSRVEDILERLKKLADASGTPPPKPWWSVLWAQLKEAIEMAGVGHAQVGLSFAREGTG